MTQRPTAWLCATKPAAKQNWIGIAAALLVWLQFLPYVRAQRVQLPLDGVYVRKILVVNSSVFSSDDFAGVTAAYEDRNLTSEDLEAVRQALTRLYIDKGYVNSGVIIPDQTVEGGVVVMQAVEGELTRIDVEGNRWFRDRYIESRLRLGAGPPLNIGELQYYLQLLTQDNRIRRVNADLEPGARPGESALHVEMADANPFKAWLAINNYISPAVGGEQGLVTLQHQNLSGNGDILSLTYGRSKGLHPQIEAEYSLPITAGDTTLFFRYEGNDFEVVEKPFDALDVENKSDIYEVTLRHPFYRSLEQELSLALTGEYLRNKTYLLGTPFSFTPGPIEGESTIFAIRFTQEWRHRSRRQVMAFRSRFSLGIDALDATINNGDLPDGRFFNWLGQLQWARIFDPLGIQALLQMNAQFSNAPLLPLEQIAVGGRYTVRGYRENLLVRDEAFTASLEIRVPIVRDRRWADTLHLVPFVDFGRSWNQDRPTPSLKSISSVGLGLRWAALLMTAPFRLNTQMELFWGCALRDVTTPEMDDLQDKGIHFQIIINGF